MSVPNLNNVAAAPGESASANTGNAVCGEREHLAQIADGIGTITAGDNPVTRYELDRLRDEFERRLAAVEDRMNERLKSHFRFAVDTMFELNTSAKRR